MKKLISIFANRHNSIPLIVGIGIFSTSTILNDPHGFFDSLWPAVVGIAVGTFNIIRAHAMDHANMIKKGIYPPHKAAWIVRALFGIGLVSLAHAYHFDWQKELWLLIFCSMYFGLVFTFHINKYLNKEIFWIGHGPKAAIIDRVYYWISPTIGGFLQMLTFFLLGGFAIFKYLS